MIRLLSRWLIPDRDNVSSPAVRRAYGTLCGAVGIALNILLFIGKFFAGQLSGSLAVTADAMSAAPEDLPVVEMDLNRPSAFMITGVDGLPLFLGTVNTMA